ncbi:MAG: CD225/dispanin family protein [Acidobacteria bacterium]|nr:CD225/dispanin family protein [Acidobacteriota bacterium]
MKIDLSGTDESIRDAEFAAIPTYLVPSAFSILFFPIGGIVALVHSLGTISATRQQNFELAQKNSRTAKIWMIISFVVGGLVLLVEWKVVLLVIVRILERIFGGR